MSATQAFSARVRECTDQLAVTGVAALGMLYDLTAQRLVRFAVTVSYHQHDAEDAVQAVLARLATSPQQLKDVGCPWAYLLRMVRNEVIAIHRRQKRCTAAGDLSDLITRCPIDEAEREESHRAVWAALRSLPVDQAEVVVLKIWEEMTFAQIGEILELSLNTVASRYQYGIAKLTSRLTKQPTRVRHG
ncbi:RNA polymerase sigma factor [Anatilimnocola floriformis]|uniref:RNA polymerase sigma factor n=1 Tax=Anatilimnocola floriformis TaxID=2948575 RepID=UPI0020C45505|nr:sigma-70 family RNA polymerase sigma factor [Anatilimnocola floriformis]